MNTSHSNNQSSLISDEEVKTESIRSERRHCCYKCRLMGDKIPARLVLYFLSWSGFLVSFMMRNDMNFALVAMIRPRIEVNNTITVINTNKLNDQNVSLSSSSSNNDVNMPQYDWSSTVESMIIGCFYWCYVLSQVVGGIATQYLGTKFVFGWSQFATAFGSLFIPIAANWHYGWVIFLRSLQGGASGLTWPAMFHVIPNWIPIVERSRFMSSFQGFSIGIGLTYLVCGYIIHNFGWYYVFFTTGTLGMLWCITWYFLGFNTPHEHPRITKKELEYINNNIDSKGNAQAKLHVPWKSIFTSVPAWVIAITTFGRIWIHYIFITSGPKFMKNILKFDYTANGFLSGMPFILSYFSSLVFCYIADKMIEHRWLKLTNVRKLFTALSQVLPAILILLIGYLDNIIWLLIVWFLAVICITASYAGAMANIIDISPNYAGPVLAFCQTIHMSASFLSPIAAGLVVKEEDSIEQWRTVFGIAAAVAIATYITYQIWGTAEIQDWNFQEIRDDAEGLSEEREVLQQTKGNPNTAVTSNNNK